MSSASAWERAITAAAHNLYKDEAEKTLALYRDKTLPEWHTKALRTHARALLRFAASEQRHDEERWGAEQTESVAGFQLWLRARAAERERAAEEGGHKGPIIALRALRDKVLIDEVEDGDVVKRVADEMRVPVVERVELDPVGEALDIPPEIKGFLGEKPRKRSIKDMAWADPWRSTAAVAYNQGAAEGFHAALKDAKQVFLAGRERGARRGLAWGVVLGLAAGLVVGIFV